jgi:hypothetical protein
MHLAIVSNQLPFTVSFAEGKPRLSTSPDGLITGLWGDLPKLDKFPDLPASSSAETNPNLK